MTWRRCCLGGATGWGCLLSATVALSGSPAVEHYVWQESPAPAPPYLTWETAAHTIQEAVDVAAGGDTVVVTNGIYAEGNRRISAEAPPNRVLINQPITVMSVNGPDVTVIEGSQGEEATRCVLIGTNATLSGFTIEKGLASDGGGVWSEWSGVVSNCWIKNNRADLAGGGVTGGIVLRCTISNNASRVGGGLANCAATNCVVNDNRASFGGGGAYASLLAGCTLTFNSTGVQGGGATECTLQHCLIIENEASLGGGAAASTLNECTVQDNRADNQGGGAFQSTLNDCSLAGNSSDDGGGANGSVLNRCAVSRNAATFFGGGASSSTLHNCQITRNASSLWGGGVSDCPVNNCSLTRNLARYGGGADSSTLLNCTVTENWALTYGGGIFSSTARNSILYHNTVVSFGSNHFRGTIEYSCTTPLPAEGVGNISAEPQLASATHLSAGSPCLGAGRAEYAGGVDIDGEAWAGPPSMGCDEPVATGLVGPLGVSIRADYTEAAVGFAVGLVADIDGQVGSSRWEFGDGTVLSNRPIAAHAWSAPGEYQLLLRAFNNNSTDGVAAMLTVRVVEMPVRYVVLDNASAEAPFASWATAAPTIQEAVDASLVAGSLILVSNGTYRPLEVPRAITLRSVNGPAGTVVDGGGFSRCVAIANGAVLSGFTLTNGVASGPVFPSGQEGGGVWCESASAVVSNCVILGNTAATGGGANGGTLNNCVLAGNSATELGGGGESVILNNCLLVGNSATFGGGVHWGVLNNCTVTGNSAAGTDGGVSICSINNCIVYGNAAPDGTNYSPFPVPPSYSCTTPLPETGVGNIDLDPQFVDAPAGNYQLAAISPCIDAGLNDGISDGLDMAGRNRIVNGTVDMGAFEYAHSQPVPPSVVRGPVGGIFMLGETVVLTVVARGTLPLSYQWYHGARLLPDENGPALTFRLDSVEQLGAYHVAIANSAGSMPSADAAVLLPNVAPSFSAGPDVEVNSRARTTAFTVPGWATAISSGPAPEPRQALTFLTTANNPGLFESGPSIDAASGELTFSLVPFALGLANVTVTLHDEGGTARGGIDTSAAQTFQIRVVHTNTPPIAHDDHVTTVKDTPVSFNVLTNDLDAEGDILGILFAFLPQPIHGHLALSPAGAMTYRPEAGFVGSIRFEYTITDGEPGGTNYATVTVTVAPEPPACRAALWSPDRALSFFGQAGLFVISLDGEQGCAVLSGGEVQSPGDTLQASWVWDGTNHASGIRMTNCFEIGCHEITLSVTDGQTSCGSTVELCVITPVEAIARCLELLDHGALDRRTKRPLVASLESAARSFERQNFVSGLNQLAAFQNKVRAQVMRRWPDQAQALLDCTQLIRAVISDALRDGQGE